MDPLVYRHERSLGRISLVLGLIGWALIVVGTFGLALVYLLLLFVGYLFAQSAFIAYLKNTAVRITPTQMPDLHAHLEACCGTLGLQKAPETYLLNGGGMLNAFATRFLGRDFVILLSDVVDAMAERPDGIRFYIGHELGHLRMKHLTGQIWRAPALWLPLLGAAYSRAKESTCDLHGRACCASSETAARALVALAAGPRRWETVALAEYAGQARVSAGFWSSFHELISGYPWLAKRLSRVFEPEAALPRRHRAAYLPAVFVPYAGRAGGGAAGFAILVMIVALLASAAIPFHHARQQRIAAAAAWTQSAPVREALARHYRDKGEIPESLEAAGAPQTLANGTAVEYDAETMALYLPAADGSMRIEPVPDEDDKAPVRWQCVADFGLLESSLPAECRATL